LKNLILAVCLLILIGLSFIFEPVEDTIDLISGASTQTFQTQIDMIAGASEGASEGISSNDDSSS